MDRPPFYPSPMAEALNWVSRITSVGMMMVLPTLGGRWLDQRQGTSYWVLIGLVVGGAIGFWQIMQIAGGSKQKRSAGLGRSSPSKMSAEKKPQSPSDSEPQT